MTSLWLAHQSPVRSDPFPTGSRVDEIVVGAGITGLTTAVLLARQGRRVAVVEARTVGAVATGNTTAKISQLQGTRFSSVRANNAPGILQAYADGNRAAFDWILDFSAAHAVPLERKTAVTWAQTEAGAEAVAAEFRLARTVGLDVTLTADAGLPFATTAAVALPAQAQFDPLDFLAALVAELRELGGSLHTGVRVRSVRASAPAIVMTDQGELQAEHVILATGTPIADRGLYFAKVSARRSYAQAFQVEPGTLPDGMFLSAEQPTRSVRTHGDALITGGFGHPVGREASPQARADALTDWTTRHWPGAVRTHAWSAQDYSAGHHVPFVGWLPRSRGRIFLATGYDKWGMTGGVAAALTLAADLSGANTPWQRTLHRRLTLPQVVATAIGENAAVAFWYAKGYAGAWRTTTPLLPPAEGSGVVGSESLRPVAISTVDGSSCALSAVCSHLGAVVTWNDAEKSWDCPAHGSRFSPTGEPLEGPATRRLTRR